MIPCRRVVFLCFLLFASFLFAQAADVVPVAGEPMHHKVLDNDFVCVFDVVVPPHGATQTHRHDRDYIFVTLGDSEISNNRVNQPPVRVALKDGDARYAKGGFAHVAQNLADTPFHNLTIELKNPGAPVCGVDPAKTCDNADPAGMVRNLMATEHLQVRLMTLQPAQQTPGHTDAHPHLAVALDDLAFENQPEGKPASMLTMKKGEFLWIDSSSTAHSLKNAGKTTGRLLTIEFL